MSNNVLWVVFSMRAHTVWLLHIRETASYFHVFPFGYVTSSRSSFTNFPVCVFSLPFMFHIVIYLRI